MQDGCFASTYVLYIIEKMQNGLLHWLTYCFTFYCSFYKPEKAFEKKTVVALFVRTGLGIFPSFKYKTYKLSQITEAWPYSNIVIICIRC